nr:metalloregulator ArsR/SmtB family transcription factor [uncultured Caproiciproducens sp.]
MKTHASYVPVFKALADETRLKIVEMLSCGEMCACDILESFHCTQPTLSYHMKILTDCGLVNSRKDSYWIRYSINAEQAAQVQEFLIHITTEQQACICKNSEEGAKCD